MIRAILQYMKNRKNPDYEHQDYEVELRFSLTDLVLFIVIIYLIYRFV